MGVGFCRNFGEICHFERSEKSTEFKIRFLNLWILRCAQYDKQKIFVVSLGFCGGLGEFLFFWGVGFVGTLGKFVILSLLQKGEKSIMNFVLVIHSPFFVDTSLRSV